MKTYSVVQAPLWSFFSAGLYRDAILRWKGTGMGYLFILLAVCWLPIMGKVHQEVSKFVSTEAPKLVKQIPTITITDGRASVKVPQPYEITEPETGNVIAVIDTTGRITSLDETEARVLVTRDGVIAKKSDFETRSFSFKEVKEFTLDRAKINGWMETIRQYLAVVLYPFALLGSFVGRILQQLIYGAIGLLLALIFKRPRSYLSLLRLSAVAMTPPILIKTVLMTARIHLPGAGLLFFVLAMGLMCLGLRAAARAEAPVPVMPPAVPPPPLV